MQAPPAPAQDSTNRQELEAYYANKPLMWRNVALIGLCNVGWGVVATVVVPLTGYDHPCRAAIAAPSLFAPI